MNSPELVLELLNTESFTACRPEEKLVVANSGPSWSSTTSESTVAAVSEACKQLVSNLTPYKQVRSSCLVWA